MTRNIVKCGALYGRKRADDLEMYGTILLMYADYFLIKLDRTQEVAISLK